MVKLNKISQIRHAYIFQDAIADADTFNGAFGEVDSTGKFKATANKAMAIMQVEEGDDEGMPTYKIKKGEHVRVGDLTKLDGQIVEVYGDEVPEDAFAKDVKLEADADGSLKKNDSATAPYFQVTSVIGNKLGIKVKVVASAE